MDAIKNKILVEIWSDLMCPYSFLGKRIFENALEQFHKKELVEVVWKSFQLIPSLPTHTTQNAYQILSQKLGFSPHEISALRDQITQYGKQFGLNYNFSLIKTTNTFDAHRLLHFAKEFGKQSQVQEDLFNAYFTYGQNIADYITLHKIGSEIGLDYNSLMTVLMNGTFAGEVRKDIIEAQQRKISNVPYFLFNRKYTLLGVHEISVFLYVLEKTFMEFENSDSDNSLKIGHGLSCRKLI